MTLHTGGLEFCAQQVAHSRAGFYFAGAQVQKLLDLAKRKAQPLHLPDELQEQQIMFRVQAKTTFCAFRLREERLALLEANRIDAQGCWFCRFSNLDCSCHTSEGYTLDYGLESSGKVRIVRDLSDIQLKRPHVISTETQIDTQAEEIGFDSLLRAALRHRPERILLGEIRASEARTFLDGLSTGHRGTMATVHADNVNGALQRVQDLALRSNSIAANETNQLALNRSRRSNGPVATDGERHRSSWSHSMRMIKKRMWSPENSWPLKFVKFVRLRHRRYG